MRQSRYLSAAVLAVIILLPVSTGFAQKSVPPVPITYPGDTEESIIRRAQWIEGARKEGSLNWWGLLNPNESSPLIAQFNKIYPFIKVNYWRGRGEEVSTKIEAEYAGGRYTADILYGGENSNCPRWAKMGIIEKFTNIVIGLDKFDRRMYSKRGDWIIPAFAPKIPQYNTRLLSAAEAPKSYEDLLNPKWKEQLGGEVEPDNWATLALAEGGWGTEKMENFLIKLKAQKPRFIQGGTAAHSLLVAGEFKVLVMGNLRHVLVSQAKKAPVDWIKASPLLVTGTGFKLPKKGPHPHASRLYLEWQFSPQGLQLLADVTQNYVPGVATPIADLLKGLPLVVRTEEVELKEVEMGLINKYKQLLFGIEN